MTLKQVAEMLDAIPGFKGKVAYRFFPEQNAPALPFICYYSNGLESFGADNITYSAIEPITIELYSARKDRASESLIEAALTVNDLYFDKSETYIESEKAYMIIYNIEV